MNTPRVVTDQQQRVVWRWENQEPFGNNPPEENPSGLGNFEFPLRFAGQYHDRETNTAYNYFRDYDPQTGRYAQSDPIGLLGGLNTYFYVGGNPSSFVDPKGLYIPGVHASLSRTQAIGTCLQGEAARLGKLTGDIDKLPNSQLPRNAHMHSMCSADDPISAKTCRQIIGTYIEGELRECTVESLARALHAIQDGFSPGHRGGQSWPGMPGTPGRDLMEWRLGSLLRRLVSSDRRRCARNEECNRRLVQSLWVVQTVTGDERSCPSAMDQRCQ